MLPAILSTQLFFAICSHDFMNLMRIVHIPTSIVILACYTIRHVALSRITLRV